MARPAARLSAGQAVHTRRRNECIGRWRCLHGIDAGVTRMQCITVQRAASLRAQGQVIVAASGGGVTVAAAAGWRIGAAHACFHNGGKDEGLAVCLAAW